jgi:hypothetical protein
MEDYQEGFGEFSSHTRFEVGDAPRLESVWHDLWCENQALKEVLVFVVIP